ncbi:MAG: diguanylate cyclase [Rhodocyclaceae bacterium]|jgi:diguanylate cyclase (GGDEF)-like protein/PAS domain S-box-containing protein
MRRLLLLAAVLLPLDAAALEKVVLQLKWKHQFQFAGYYAAAAQGYYRDAGLEVAFIEAGPETDPVAEVVSGRAQYGVSNSALLLARARGEPVTALAVVFQHSPLILAARAESGIRSVRDLAGKRLMIEPHADEIYAFLRRAGLHENRLVVLPHSLDHQDLIDGRADVMTAYSTDEPYFFEQRGFRHLEFSPRVAGIDFYGDNLFTSARELADHPARVRAFREASLKGWRHAMAHPGQTADLILSQYGRRHSRAHLLYEANRMVPLLQVDLVEPGYMNAARWRQIAAAYAELGMLPKDFSLDGFLYEPAPAADTRMAKAFAVSSGLALILSAGLAGLFLLTRRLRREIGARQRIETDLRESDRKFRTIADTTPIALLITRPEDGRVIYANRAAAELGGLPEQDLVGSDVTRFYPEPDARRHFIEALRATGSVRNEVIEFVRGDGTPVLTQRSATLGTLDDRPAIFVAIADLRERKRLEDALRARGTAIEAAAEGIAITDPDGVIEYVNPALTAITGHTADELVGRHTRLFNSGHHDKPFYDHLWHTIRSGQVWRGEIVNRRRDGSHYTELMAIAPVRNEQGETVHFVAVKHDITERKQMETELKENNDKLLRQLYEINRLQAELREQAVRDGLTNLFNRRYLDETLERELARAKREGYPLSLVMLDIDHFKQLNDTYGHQAGDKVLRELAALLWGDVRAEDVPCRYGGEEFVVLLPRMPLEIALQRAEGWRRTLHSTRIPFGDFQLEATLSCGLAAYPENARTPDELIRCCDQALYSAKNQGRNRCEVYAAQPAPTDKRPC